MKKATKVLVVDDEKGIRDLLCYELGSRGYTVVSACNGEEAVEKVKKEKFSLMVSDVKMPKLGGMETLEAVKKLDPDIEVIMSTGYGTIETAVQAMKKGAYDFVQKPFNLDEILALIEKALEKSELKAIIAVYEASKAIFNSVNLDQLLGIIVDLSMSILKADDVSIMLAGPNARLAVAASAGTSDGPGKQARLAAAERVARNVGDRNDALVIAAPLASDPVFAGIEGLQDVKSSIFYPLVIEGQLLGVLNVNRTKGEDPFNGTDLRSVTIFGSQVAQAVHNANLYRRLEGKIQELNATYAQLEDSQEQLIQSEKLAAIGQLVAGVAHELNNPLTGILGFSELLLQGGGLSEEQREDIAGIHEQSKRCRSIIQNLLQFARKKKSLKQRVELIPLMESTLQLCRYDLSKSHVALVKELASTLPPVYADGDQLQQVFLNLITNARHAMEGKPDARLTIKARAQEGRVVLRFEDNGCGILKENLGKIFDPFFTTKSVGQGTGLGLSLSYGIIQQHSGAINVESQAGEGSSFIIDLPAFKERSNERKNDTGR